MLDSLILDGILMSFLQTPGLSIFGIFQQFLSIKTFSVLDQDSSAWWSWCRKCLLSMLIVVEQGGIAPGGNNFDCKLRRESTDIEESPI